MRCPFRKPHAGDEQLNSLGRLEPRHTPCESLGVVAGPPAPNMSKGEPSAAINGEGRLAVPVVFYLALIGRIEDGSPSVDSRTTAAAWVGAMFYVGSS